MKILHYMFGLPPVRDGGLVRYVLDLIEQEAKMGEDVRLLIPGAPALGANRKTKILNSRTPYREIRTYEIYHPLPVPMCNGIRHPGLFMQTCTGSAYRSFLRRLMPDLIHIHTFMGLHREFLAEARRQKIPVLFTSHDYFGICPTAVLLCGNRICKDSEWKGCAQCARKAFPVWRLKLEQSAVYRIFRKQERIVCLAKKLCVPIRRNSGKYDAGRFRAKADVVMAGIRGIKAGSVMVSGEYAALRDYYRSMFRLVSYFHFNSSAASTIYRVRLQGLTVKGSIVPVSHQGIADCRRKRIFGKTLRIGYFGSWSMHKGFFDLLKACGRLREKGCVDLELHIYSGTAKRKECFVRNHSEFGQGQLAEVFDGIDVLAMPSRWPETFGLAALEAVSFGVPVILPEYAGAMDLLRADMRAGFVYDGTVQGLEESIRKIYDNRELLAQANAAILRMDMDFSYERHVRQILEIYRKVCATEK